MIEHRGGPLVAPLLSYCLKEGFNDPAVGWRQTQAIWITLMITLVIHFAIKMRNLAWPRPHSHARAFTKLFRSFWGVSKTRFARKPWYNFHVERAADYSRSNYLSLEMGLDCEYHSRSWIVSMSLSIRSMDIKWKELYYMVSIGIFIWKCSYKLFYNVKVL